MKALQPKGKKKVIYLFPQAGSEFQVSDHELIDVCVMDLTPDEISQLRGSVLEKYGPDYYLVKKLQME
jgi:hypothetical protein